MSEQIDRLKQSFEDRVRALQPISAEVRIDWIRSLQSASWRRIRMQPRA